MKILVICQHYYPENFVITKIAEEFLNQGHDVTVLTGKPNYGYDGKIPEEYRKVKYEEINGVKVHRVKLYPRKKGRLSIIRNYLSFWRNSKKWVRKCKEKYDIVYSMSISPATILAPGNLYKKKHNVPHIVHCVDLWPESVLITHAVRKKSLVYRWLYKWSRSLYSHADRIIIGSPSYKEYFENVLKITDKGFRYIPQPSLVEEYHGEAFKYDKDVFNMLYCGNLGTIQLIPLIPEAMNLLKDEKVHFHIIGMGPMSDSLKESIAKYNLKNVTYYGPMAAPKAAQYFVDADALYVPLKGEGSVGKTIPNKTIMSMAFKKPILAVLKGDGRWLLEESKGAVFADENAESIANAIREMMKMSKENLALLGSNNYNYYHHNLTVKKITEEILKELIVK